MIWRSYKIKIILELLDFITVLISFCTGYLLWKSIQGDYPNFFGHAFEIGYFELLIMVVSAFFWVIIFNYSTAYRYQRFTSIETEFNKIILASIFGTMGVVVFIFVFRIPYVPRTLVGIIFFVSIVFLFAEKILIYYFAAIMRRRGRDRKKVLIVGTNKRAIDLIHTVHEHFGWGLDIVGIVTGESGKVGTQFHGYPVISTIKNMRRILHNHVVSEVIVTISTKLFDQISNVISICEEEGVQIRLNSDFFGSLNKRLKIDYVYDLPFISIMQIPNDGFSSFVKRVLDILVSVFLLIFLSPLFLFIAVSIKLTSRGPVLFGWDVVGLNKRPFKSWKFRTMIPEADQIKEKLMDKNEMKGPVFKIENDPRVTPIGCFLRKYSLDELPQLFSVLKGDMSLVGPRPPLQNEFKRFDYWHRRKLSIKPGITCLWQISGRNDINSFDDWVKLDLEYIDNWSLWLDLKILFKTISAVIKGTGK